MPRYEFKEGTSSKFWQIDLEGASFKTTYGKIGTPGRFGTKRWDDAATAKKEYEKLIAEKTKKGYTLVGGGKAAATNGSSTKVAGTMKAGKAGASASAKAAPAAKAAAKAPAPSKADAKKAASLEKAIESDPDNADAWSVYADWLQSQGDPRGELAAVQLRLADDPKNASLIAAEKKLLKEHGDVLVGNLAKYMCRPGSKAVPGFTNKPWLGPDARRDEGKNPPITSHWKAGFISWAFIGFPGYEWAEGGDDDDGDGGGGGEVDIPKLLGELLSNPAGRFLSGLTVGMAQNMEDGENDYAPVIKALVKHEGTPRLRRLYIGDVMQEECEVSWLEIDDLSKLWAKVPKLRSLTLRGGSMKLGPISLPDLRDLTIVTGGLDKKSIASICAAKWPKLEKLELWMGSKSYGANSTIKDLKPIFDAKGFPALKHLGLRNCEYTDEIAAAIGDSKIIKQLDVLDLSNGCMTDVGGNALLKAKSAFSKLTRLDLSNNFLAASTQAAGKIMNQVRTKPQRKADIWGEGAERQEHRYVVLGE